MKNVFVNLPVTALLLLLSVTVRAQHKVHTKVHSLNPASSQALKRKQHLYTLIDKQQAVNKPQNKRTSATVAERVIAISSYDIADSYLNIIGINDSFYFKYSGSRGSDFDYNLMGYLPLYYSDGSQIMGFGGDVGFPDHDNQLFVLFDSALIWQSVFIYDSFGFTNTEYAKYDANNNATEYADLYLQDPSMTYDDNRCINTYDIYNNVATSLILSWDMGVWDTSEYRRFYYNTSQQVIKDSTQTYLGGGSWSDLEAWQYFYDGSGNMINANYYEDSSGIWMETQRFSMRYNSTNQLTWDTISQYLGGRWQPQASDTFGYTAGHSYRTYERSLTARDGTPDSYVIFSKHIGSTGLPDTMYQMEYSAIDATIIDGSRTYYQYDSYKMPTKATQYNFNIDPTTYTTGWYDTTPYYITYYYYETYENNVAVNNVPIGSVQVRIFPNPTTDEINIAMPDIEKGKQTNIEIINSSGQKVHSESFSWFRQTETISLSGLIPGIYWVIIYDKGGNVIADQQIVKK